MSLWFPVYAHPSGPSDEPWYVVRHDWAFRTAEHPSGATDHPSFRIDGARIVNVDEHDGECAEPWFLVRGSLLYPADGHPTGPSHLPWYQAR